MKFYFEHKFTYMLFTYFFILFDILYCIEQISMKWCGVRKFK